MRKCEKKHFYALRGLKYGNFKTTIILPKKLQKIFFLWSSEFEFTGGGGDSN